MPTEQKVAYATLLTNASYLAGVIILSHTLEQQGSKYPLVVLYTTQLAIDAVQAIRLEATKSNLIPRLCDALLPPEPGSCKPVADRFKDTWTKLRVFELFGYDRVCFLDADMMVLKNMDSVFGFLDLPLDHIAANHACICNPDKKPWAPKDWSPENCAYTPQTHPEALVRPMQVTPFSRPTQHLLNSGLFLFHPSKDLWSEMLTFFNTTDKLSTFGFPDQDFLDAFFENRWVSLPWQYNAVKTMRYRHSNIWRDEEVVCVHYIVDKPWNARVRDDGVAGFKGCDGETHQWWWDQYEQWRNLRALEGPAEVVEIVSHHVAKVGDCSVELD